MKYVIATVLLALSLLTDCFNAEDCRKVCAPGGVAECVNNAVKCHPPVYIITPTGSAAAMPSRPTEDRKE